MTGQSESDEDDPAAWWNEVYESETVPPWNIGEPQPALVDVVKSKGLFGRVLDIGCGTGTHALWATERGHTAVGVDVSETGIEQAQTKAESRNLDATFRVANALDLPADVGTFDTVMDSGLFHVFEKTQRVTYARELARVVSVGGFVFLVGFTEGAPEDWGPNPFTPEDVRAAFRNEWDVIETRDAEFKTRETPVQGLLAVVERI